MTSPVVSEAEKDLSPYVVRFYNSVSQNLHSAITVLVSDATDAVEEAIKNHHDGPEAVRTLTASVSHPNGEGVPGIEQDLSSNALQRQIDELQKQLAEIQRGQEERPSGVPESVASPAPANSDVTPDSRYSPSQSQVSAGTSIPATDAPNPNAGAITSVDINRATPE
jgi:hypothetical protein